MRALLQRVKEASVSVNGGSPRKIGPGLAVLLGVAQGDKPENSRWLAEKTAQLRIFSNEMGKFDRSLIDIRGEILIVSQFTLQANCRKGRRPDFNKAAAPELARGLYDGYVEAIKAQGLSVTTGDFGAKMLITLSNDGPVTILLDTAEGPTS